MSLEALQHLEVVEIRKGYKGVIYKVGGELREWCLGWKPREVKCREQSTVSPVAEKSTKRRTENCSQY